MTPPRLRRRPRAPRPDDPTLLPAPPLAADVLDARLSLLDRQVLDVHGTPVTTVDDLELLAVGREDDASADALIGRDVLVVAVLSGPSLLTRIVGGRAPRSRLHRLPWEIVADVGVGVALAVPGELLDVTWTERWVRDRLVRRIPGGTHDPG